MLGAQDLFLRVFAWASLARCVLAIGVFCKRFGVAYRLLEIGEEVPTTNPKGSM